MLTVDSKEYDEKLATVEARGFIINPPAYGRVRRWNYILFQLDHAGMMIQLLQQRAPTASEIQHSHEHVALFHSAVISYGRCFTKAKASVLLNDCLVFEDAPHLKNTHEDLMGLRHELVAHAGRSDAIRVAIAVKEELAGVSVEHITHLGMPNKPELKQYAHTIRHVKTFTQDRLQKEVTKIEKKRGLTIIGRSNY